MPLTIVHRHARKGRRRQATLSWTIVSCLGPIFFYTAIPHEAEHFSIFVKKLITIELAN